MCLCQVIQMHNIYQKNDEKKYIMFCALILLKRKQPVNLLHSTCINSSYLNNDFIENIN